MAFNPIQIIFPSIGILFVILGILLLKWSGKRKETASMITTAEVVDIRRRRSQNGSSYHPVFSYYAEGRQHQIESNVGSTPCRYKLGEQVELHYVPGKPEKIWTEKNEGVMKLCCGIFIAIGSLFFVIGIILNIALF